MTYLLTPPTRAVRRGEHPLFGRMSFRRGVSLLKVGGLYRQVIEPSDEEIVAAQRAYLGGHEYEVDDDEYADLVAAGYAEWLTPIGSAFYGSGTYGFGTFGQGGSGVGVVVAPPLFGVGDFGAGPYGGVA